MWEESGKQGERLPFFQVTKDGKAHIRQADYQLQLRANRFDPLQEVPAPPPARFAGNSEQNVYIVQFVTQSLEAYRQAIRQAGGSIYFYIANYAHVVKMSQETRAKVAKFPFVRWIGPYHPAYRLDEEILEDAIRGLPGPSLKYNILLFESELAVKSDVATRIENMGGSVDRVHAGKYLQEAVVTLDQLAEIVSWDEVVYADRWAPNDGDMDIVREVGGINLIENLAGLTGEGVRGEIFDDGFNLAHIDHSHHPLIPHTEVHNTHHGTAVSGVIFGDGTGRPDARGILPRGQGIVIDTDFVDVGLPRYDRTAELLQAPYFAVFQSSTIGGRITPNYGTLSSEMDATLFDFDIFIAQTQGNQRAPNSRPQAWAKNIISVGGIQHNDTADRADDCWCFRSSIGPAADGRVKPDLASFSDHILTTGGASGSTYTLLGGTSAAAAIVAGQAGLVFEMWHLGILGNNPDPNATVFENRCHMTTMKALLINTAYRYEMTGGLNEFTRGHQGWGMPDLAALYNSRDNILIVDEEKVITNLETASYSVQVNSGEPEFKATLVFADPRGLPISAQHRINDLNLRVTSPSGTVYWGNYGLAEANTSLPGGSPNALDTVENVFVQSPEAGVWSVDVIANEINQDGHVETPGPDADFALVVTGGVETPGFGIGVTPDSQEVCGSSDGIVNLSVNGRLGFSDAVNLSVSGLPPGAVARFSNNSITPDGESILTVSNLAAVPPGDYTFTVTGTSASLTKPVFVNMHISHAIPPAPEQLLPENGKLFRELSPLLSWEASEQNHLYYLEMSRDNVFSNIVYSATTEATSHRVTTELRPQKCYFWRVRGSNGCGFGEWQKSGFTTMQTNLQTQRFQFDFDLDETTVAYIPDGSGNYYRSCIDPASSLPVDPTGGTVLSYTINEWVRVNPTTPLTLYGTQYDELFVGANGYITLNYGDISTGGFLGTHFRQPGISFLSAPLEPSEGGTVSYKELADRFVLTFERVPERTAFPNENTVQVQWLHNGEIHITWMGVGVRSCVVGLSRGTGMPNPYNDTDFSVLASCSTPPPLDIGLCMGLDCPPDLTGNLDVDEEDFLLGVTRWRRTDVLGDLNENGPVDAIDLLLVLASFGRCDPPD